MYIGVALARRRAWAKRRPRAMCLSVSSALEVVHLVHRSRVLFQFCSRVVHAVHSFTSRTSSPSCTRTGLVARAAFASFPRGCGLTSCQCGHAGEPSIGHMWRSRQFQNSAVLSIADIGDTRVRRVEPPRGIQHLLGASSPRRRAWPAPHPLGVRPRQPAGVDTGTTRAPSATGACSESTRTSPSCCSPRASSPFKDGSSKPRSSIYGRCSQGAPATSN